MQPAAILPRTLLLAAGMLSVVRVRVPGRVSDEDLRASTSWYPLVGLGVGILPAGVLLLPLPPLPRAALALAAWVVVTGALHLDGWTDCCDAAFAPARPAAQSTRERRLAILKDPHLGTFGAAGLFLLLLAKWAALAHVPVVAPLLAAPVARWTMVHALATHPPARSDGLGATFAGQVPLARASAALMGAVLLPIGFGGDPLRVVAAVAAGVAVALLAAAALVRRFGGLTGDVCGAAGEAAELAVLWSWIPWGLG